MSTSSDTAEAKLNLFRGCRTGPCNRPPTNRTAVTAARRFSYPTDTGCPWVTLPAAPDRAARHGS